MARALRSGAISFGLVNVPVRRFSAIAEKDLHFHLIHEPDGSRIQFPKKRTVTKRAKSRQAA
jgi:DNA end-binding protein Ku